VTGRAVHTTDRARDLLGSGRDEPRRCGPEALAHALQLKRATTDHLIASPRRNRGSGTARAKRSCRPASRPSSRPWTCPRSWRAATSTSSPPTTWPPPSPRGSRPVATGHATSSSTPPSGRCSPSGRTASPDSSPASALRERVGTDTDDPRVVQLVGELSLATRALPPAVGPARRAGPGGPHMHFAHPQVGVRTLRCEKLAVNGADGQPLVVQHAEPRSAGRREADHAHLPDTVDHSPASTPRGHAMGDRAAHKLGNGIERLPVTAERSRARRRESGTARVSRRHRDPRPARRRDAWPATLTQTCAYVACRPSDTRLTRSAAYEHRL